MTSGRAPLGFEHVNVATLYSEPSWRSTEGTPLSTWPQRRTVHESRVHRQASSYARAVKQSRCSSGSGKLGADVAVTFKRGRLAVADGPQLEIQKHPLGTMAPCGSQTVEFGWLHPDQAARALLGTGWYRHGTNRHSPDNRSRTQSHAHSTPRAHARTHIQSKLSSVFVPCAHSRRTSCTQIGRFQLTAYISRTTYTVRQRRRQTGMAVR